MLYLSWGFIGAGYITLHRQIINDPASFLTTQNSLQFVSAADFQIVLQFLARWIVLGWSLLTISVAISLEFFFSGIERIARSRKPRLQQISLLSFKMVRDGRVEDEKGYDYDPANPDFRRVGINKQGEVYEKPEAQNLVLYFEYKIDKSAWYFRTGTPNTLAYVYIGEAFLPVPGNLQNLHVTMQKFSWENEGKQYECVLQN